MDVTLIMFRDDGDHRRFHVTKSVTTIGRREDCDLRIAVGDVSRKHCKLTVASDAAQVEDLGSSNGTFVNGERVKEHRIGAGDLLKVGPVLFIVQIDGEPAPEAIEDKIKAMTTSSAAAASVSKPSSAARPARPAAKAGSIDDEIDELSILNDSSAGSRVEFDLGPDESKG